MKDGDDSSPPSASVLGTGLAGAKGESKCTSSCNPISLRAGALGTGHGASETRCKTMLAGRERRRVRFEEPQFEVLQEADEREDLLGANGQVCNFCVSTNQSNSPGLCIWPEHPPVDDIPTHDESIKHDLNIDRRDVPWHDGSDLYKDALHESRFSSGSPSHISQMVCIWPSSCMVQADAAEAECMDGEAEGSDDEGGSVEQQSNGSEVGEDEDSVFPRSRVQIWPPPLEEEQLAIKAQKACSDELARRYNARDTNNFESGTGGEIGKSVMCDQDASYQLGKNRGNGKEALLFTVSAQEWNGGDENGSEDLKEDGEDGGKDANLNLLEPCGDGEEVLLFASVSNGDDTSLQTQPTSVAPPNPSNKSLSSSAEFAADLAAELRCLSLGLADDAVAGYQLRRQRRMMEVELKRAERCQHAAWLAEVQGLAPGSSRLLRAMVAKGNRNVAPRATDAASDGVSTSSGGPRADVLSMHSSSSSTSLLL